MPDDQAGVFVFVRRCPSCDRDWTYAVTVEPHEDGATVSYGVHFRPGAEPVTETAVRRRENGWLDLYLDGHTAQENMRMDDSVRRRSARRAEKLGVKILKCECGAESDERALDWRVLASGEVLCPFCAAGNRDR